MTSKKLLSGTGVLIAAILAMATIILANTTLTSWRLDLTENRLYTLSEGTLNIIRSLDEPITLDFYFSSEVLSDVPQIVNYANRVRDLLGEYAAKSNGMIRLNVIEPEPFSEEEDRAVASGLQGVTINVGGSPAYFGLVGTNAVDDELTIPFFQNSREQQLEYDLTKLIYNLANPEKRVVGVLSQLPAFGGSMPGSPQGWVVADLVSEFFEVKHLGPDVSAIEDIDLLLLIHPKDIDEETLFAIDQYLLGGGNAVVFVDPMAEGDNVQPDPRNPRVLPRLSSSLEPLFAAWGIEVSEDQIAGDLRSAMRVQSRTERGIQETNYLPWLRLDKSNLNPDEFITGELNTINLGTAGFISKKEDAAIDLVPLIQTSAETMKIDADLIRFQQDPARMLSDFESGNERLTLAARISGTVSTAFPEGRPASDQDSDTTEAGQADEDFLTEGEINLIVVADTDILNDTFWINRQNFLGIEMPQAIADNGNFLINALEHMSGSTDLISLRSRGEYSRPFEVVEEIRREAEARFRQREQMLEAKLRETEQKIFELQRESGEGDLLLSPEQSREIEKFRQEQLNTRKELRAVQHELQKNIEQLGTLLKFINIGLMPLVISIIAVSVGLIRTRRMASQARNRT